MKAHTITLNSPNQIHEIFADYKPDPPTGWWYRGQADKDWQLIPKAGRIEFNCSKNAFGRFNAWSNKAQIYKKIPSNKWQRLALAQHHGLATCLLDWTYNPLVSIFFACNQLKEKDGAIFIYEPNKYLKDDIMNFELIENHEKNEILGYIPPSITQRIVNQKGAFTVHIPVDHEPIVNKRFEIIDHPNLVKIIIKSEFKDPLLNLLRSYGIDESLLFPDLDGLSKTINEQTKLIAQRSNSKSNLNIKKP